MDKLIADAKLRMKKVTERLQHDYATVRTGRASPTLLDRVRVEYYGSEMPINQLATIGVPEARMITITPWDKAALRPIEKAILTSDLNLTPSSDGHIIRLEIPTLTEERRKELQRTVGKMAEEARVAVRNIRRDANSGIDKMEKSDGLSEDEVERGKKEIQEITDKAIGEIDKLAEAKAKEVTEV